MRLLVAENSVDVAPGSPATIQLEAVNTLDVIDGVTATRPSLDAFLLDLHTRLSAAADAVDHAHFVHVTPSFSLVGPAGAEPSIGRAA